MNIQGIHTKKIADLGSKVKVIRAPKIYPIIINNIVSLKVTVWYVMRSAGSVWYGECQLGMMGCAALVCKECGKAGIL